MSSGLRGYMNLIALRWLPESSRGFRASFPEQLDLICSSGYVGVQFTDVPTRQELAECSTRGLRVCGSGRVNEPPESGAVAERFVDCGFDCGTIHLGWDVFQIPAAFKHLSPADKLTYSTSHNYGQPVFATACTNRSSLLRSCLLRTSSMRAFSTDQRKPIVGKKCFC